MSPNPPDDSRRLIRVYLAASPADAQLVAQWLEEQGVATSVQGDMLWMARGEIPAGPSTGPSVWVWEEDAERARTLLDERPAAASQQPDWTCAECGEEVEGQFTACWNCGTERPE